MYIKVTKSGPQRYVQLVESCRDEKINNLELMAQQWAGKLDAQD